MLKLNKTYFGWAVTLFFIEIVIGFFISDAYIRPYGGDLLVVILIYCLIKSFVQWPVNITLASVLAFACGIEVLQYFHMADLPGLRHSPVARVILGTQFAWADILMYTLGTLLVWLIEKLWIRV